MCREIDDILRFQLNDNKKAVLIVSDVITGNANNLRVLSSGLEAQEAQQSIYEYVKKLSG
jgi:hypothetical protein